MNENNINIIVEQNQEAVVKHDAASAFIAQAVMNSLEKSNKSTAVDIKDKKLLSVEEAAELFGIGRTKIRELSNGEDCKFVLWVGGHRKIKREEFDQYLKSQYSV
jgi:excisionase family DNA binding protein